MMPWWFFSREALRDLRVLIPLIVFFASGFDLYPAATQAAHAAQVTLAWDSSSEANLAGYKVYYGTSSRDYATQETVGKVYSHTLTSLQDGTTYYFAATAYDSYGNESAYSAEVVYTTPSANLSPVAQTGTLSTNQDTTTTGKLVAMDPNGDVLTYSIVSQGTNGTVTLTNAATGTYSYTPKSGVRGSDVFTFKATDPGGLSSTATVSVTILAVNHAPVAQGGTLAIAYETMGGGVLVATDADGDSLTYLIAAQGSKGAALITNAASGSYTYTPNSGASGTDSFTFQVRDSGGLTATAAISVTIAPANQAPVAGNGSLNTIQNTAVSGKLSATDANGDILTYQVVTNARLGAVSLNAATGSFTYTPNSTSTGTDTFTFKANDGKADSNIATVTLTISSHVTIQLEAEQGTLTVPMVAASSSNAGGGKYIWVPNGTGNLSDPSQAGGQAVYNFSVPAAGNYRVWGRVSANTVSDNSFFISMDYGPSVTWHTALGAKDAWLWDLVTDSNEAEAAVFYLTAGTHTLVVKQMEDGTKLDTLVITTQPAWIAETMYCNAETGGIEGWDVFDAFPTGATITNVSDAERGGQVIRVAGSNIYNGYLLRSGTYSNWANGNQFVIAWSMKYAEDFIVYVEVQTTRGYRYFQYEPLNWDLLGSFTQMRLGLGTGAKDGQWHSYIRDLQADLTLSQPGTKILQVNSFSVRGSGRIDDVRLRDYR